MGAVSEISKISGIIPEILEVSGMLKRGENGETM